MFVVGTDVGHRATSFAPWGADVAVDLPEPLPLPLLVGGWLTAGRHRSFVVLDPGLDPAECAGIGRDLAADRPRVALVVMGDGSARHTEKAPGYVDPRAAGWDRRVHSALAAADTGALLALDAAEAEQLLAVGRAPWQLLAGAAAGAGLAAAGASLTAPYGVGYHVVTWQ